MKLQKLFFVLSFLFSLSLFAQVPQGISYQTLLKDTNQDPIINQSIGFEISIIQTSPTSPAIYTETHTITTNDNGVAALTIGQGNVSLGQFDSITWGSDSFYLDISVDTNGGSNYGTSLGNTELLAVPYSYYAKVAGDLNIPATINDLLIYDGSSWIGSSITINNNGNDQPFSVEQPSLGINYIISLGGVFPSSGGSSIVATPFIGQIIMFAGNYVPSGWALCNGQILNITTNQALFAIIGKTYGGNGTSTFALPDLRGRAPVGVGNGSV